MDYYEELGLSRTASVDEIRQAYRHLVRLIHPDQQVEEDLRRLAELQMKRLNLILDVLTDPVQRRQYDLSLALRPGEAAQLMPRRAPLVRRELVTNRGVWVWLAAVTLGVAAIVVFFVQYGGAGSEPPAGRIAAQTSPPAAVPAEQERHEVAEPARRHPSEPEPPVPRIQAGQTAPAKKPPHAELPGAPELQIQPGLALAPQLTPPVVTGPPAGEKSEAPGFGGNWVYVPSADAKEAKGLYPPQYIELRIAEGGGQVQGLYRARYLVADRAISPTVVFRFAGRAAAPSSTLAWSGPGGAQGRVSLKLLSANSLEVRWTANQLSEELGLISGMATLVRRREP